MGVFSAIRGFLLFSNVHGFGYVANKEVSWLGKLYWLLCIVLCWVASIILISDALDQFENNSISFVSDTAYLEWENDFPAVYFCETESDLTDTYVEELWGEDSPLYAPDIFNEIAFFRGSASILSEHCKKPENFEACKMSFKLISSKVRQNCSTLFIRCMWNDKPLDCCKYFKPLETELGICYAINSWQTEDDLKSGESRLSTHFHDYILSTLTFVVSSPGEIYIMSTESTPSIRSPDYKYKIALGQQRTYLVVKREVVNEDSVRNVEIEKRNCRYLDENYLTVQKYYSHVGCILEQRKAAHFKYCNCTHHLMPNSKEVCDLEGLLCLHNHEEDVNVIKPPWSKKNGLAIDCLPACDEDDISILHIRDGLTWNTTYAYISVRMNAFPSERFKRTVVRDKLDLAVSIGGSVGLFVGASILSVVEIFYYFGMRLWEKTAEDKPNEQYLRY